MDAILYSGSIGINNKVPPHRLKYDGESGVAALESATDVIISRTGEIVTRRGTVMSESGSFHSTHKTDGGFYVVKDRDSDSALYRAVINSDGSIDLNGVRSGMAKGRRISYTAIGSTVYYSNGTNYGILNFDESSPWPTSEWSGPDDNREFLVTFPGKHIGASKGVIAFSKGPELFFTMYGLPGLYDAVGHVRRFGNEIKMVCPTENGWFVSDEDCVYHILGTNPDTFTVRKVLGYKAVEYAVDHSAHAAKDFGFDSNELCSLFGTINGPVVGFKSGDVFNLIEDVYTVPQECGSMVGSIMVIDETMVLQSGE